MSKRTMTKSLFAGLLAACTLFGMTACEAPEEPEQPESEAASATAPDEAPEEGAEGEDPFAEMAEAEGEDPAAEGMEPPEGEAAQLEQPPQQDQAQGDPMQQQQPPAAQGEPVDVSDDDLDQFAEAVNLTSELQEEHGLQEKMMEADSPEKQQEIQQEFVTELQTEIPEQTDLSFGEYMAMAQTIERDPELQQKLAERME